MRHAPFIVSTVLLLAGFARADKRAVVPEPVSSVESKVAIKGGGEAVVVVRNWIIHNESVVERFPEEGMIVVELRGGTRMTAIVDGKPEEHTAAETWIVPAGKSMSLQTGRDSIVLHTIAFRLAAPPRQPVR